MKLSPGKRVVRWTLVEKSGKRGWLCRCDCGTSRVVASNNLLTALRAETGGSRSCGCFKAERTSQTHFKHGLGYSDYRYRTWRSIKRRCFVASDADYAYYGGRGIRMHEPWVGDFAAFMRDLDAEIGQRPPAATLDRIDNSGNYEPGNLRWASRRDQAGNRRHGVGQALPQKHGSRRKLTPDQVDQIKALGDAGFAQVSIAATFGVSQAHVSRILRESH